MSSERPSTGRPPRRRRRRRFFPRIVALVAAFLVLAVLGPTLLSRSPGGDDLTAQLKALAREEPKANPLLDQENYPRELLELALRNREALDFVLDYPEKKDRAPADRVDGVEKGEFPLLLQWDQAWGYVQYGDGPIALTGCGPTALAMAVCGLTGDGDATPSAVADYAQQAGYYVAGAGSSWELMSTGCRHFGLESKELSLSRSAMVKTLESGKPIICSMGPGDFTTSGHFILLTGVEGGKFRVNDPNSRQNSEKLWDYDTLSPQIRNLWAFSLA